MAGVDCCCSTAEDWINKISYFIDSDERYKEDLAQQGNEYIEKYHQKEKILKNWDSILESV